MTNPFTAVYDALWGLIEASPEVRAIASVVSQDRALDGVSRRDLADGQTIRIALVPLPGGTLENISTTTTRITEHFTLSAIAGNLTGRKAVDLKWALILSFWRKRRLGLDYVEGVTVDAVSRRGIPVPNSIGDERVTWEITVDLSVSILLNRSDLPMES